MSKWIECGPPRMGESEPLRWDELLNQRNEALDLLEEYLFQYGTGGNLSLRASKILNRLRVKRPLTQFQEKAMREALRGVSYDEAIGALCDAIDDLRKEIK